jgi:hypothetical protein
MKKNIPLLLFTITLLYACSQLQDKQLPRPYHSNQQDVDSIYHTLYQERKLYFKTSSDRPDLLNDQAFLLNNAVQCFDDKGTYEQKLTYGGSKVELHFPPDHLPSISEIKEVNYRWYYPRQWFKELSMHLYNDSLSVHYLQDSTNTWVDIELFYPTRLTLEQIHLQQGGILGSTIYNKKSAIKSKERISTVLTQKAGYVKIRTDIAHFMSSWGNFYYKPDEMDLKTRFLFLSDKQAIQAKKSNKKDPKYKEKQYAPANFGRGNYYRRLPSLEPYYQIEVKAKQRIPIYEHYLPEDKKIKWEKRRLQELKNKQN